MLRIAIDHCLKHLGAQATVRCGNTDRPIGRRFGPRSRRPSYRRVNSRIWAINCSGRRWREWIAENCLGETAFSGDALQQIEAFGRLRQFARQRAGRRPNPPSECTAATDCAAGKQPKRQRRRRKRQPTLHQPTRLSATSASERPNAGMNWAVSQIARARV